jgi:hypothetical protein
LLQLLAAAIGPKAKSGNGVRLTGGIGAGLYVASALAAGNADGVASYWLIEWPKLSHPAAAHRARMNAGQAGEASGLPFSTM